MKTAFRRVDAQRAGPAALGILVPPGQRTLVIARPRGLDWDLLPARWDGDPATAPVFCQFGRDEAAGVARRFHEALVAAVLAGTNPVETIGAASGGKFQVWVRAGEFVWIACARAAGQSYQPLLFTSRAEAESAGRRLEPIFHPAPDAQQEFYFNTQNLQACTLPSSPRSAT